MENWLHSDSESSYGYQVIHFQLAMFLNEYSWQTNPLTKGVSIHRRSEERQHVNQPEVQERQSTLPGYFQ